MAISKKTAAAERTWSSVGSHDGNEKYLKHSLTRDEWNLQAQAWGMDTDAGAALGDDDFIGAIAANFDLDILETTNLVKGSPCYDSVEGKVKILESVADANPVTYGTAVKFGDGTEGRLGETEPIVTGKKCPVCGGDIYETSLPLKAQGFAYFCPECGKDFKANEIDR